MGGDRGSSRSSPSGSRAPSSRGHGGLVRPGFPLLVTILSLGLLGCVQIELFGGGRHPLVESVVHVQGEGGERGAKLLMIEIDGVIGPGDGSSLLGLEPEGTAARVAEELARARQDSSLKGVLLRIQSPGGDATSSDVIYSELMRFKRERGLPIVAHLYGLAASGGYYVAMAADELVAEPTTVTGSIGVIFTNVSFAGLMERLGIEDTTTKAGAFKDTGSVLRRQTPADRAILQGVIDDLHERFREVVDAGRPKLGRERVDELSDGRIYSARQALENGLVDRIGDVEAAVSVLQARAGADRSYVVSYHRPGEWRQNLHTRAQRVVSPSSVGERLGGSSVWPAPGFLYLWWPEAGLPWPRGAVLRWSAPGMP